MKIIAAMLIMLSLTACATQKASDDDIAACANSALSAKCTSAAHRAKAIETSIICSTDDPTDYCYAHHMAKYAEAHGDKAYAKKLVAGIKIK